MNRFNILVLSLTVLVLVVQIFIPVFNFNNLDVVADILIIFLTYIGFYYGRFYTIILGFIFGITQDLITQIDLLGAMALTKSIIGFGGAIGCSTVPVVTVSELLRTDKFIMGKRISIAADAIGNL